MIKYLVILFLFCNYLVGQISFPTNTISNSNSQFSLITFYPSWYFTSIESNKFSFPSYPLVYPVVGFPAFVVKTNQTAQKVSGGLIKATYKVTTTNNAVFRFGGQGTWNTGTTPPHARLFFASKIGYNNQNTCPECYWWSQDGWKEMADGVFTLVANLDPSRWSDSIGRYSTNNFYNALSNVMELGVAFGGGSFYDIGVAMTSGEAEFEMISVRILEPVNIILENSCNLSNWNEFSSFIFQPTNDATFFRLRIDNQ